MSHVVPIMQSIDQGVGTRAGVAVRMDDGGMFVLEIYEEIADPTLKKWFDLEATFRPQ